MNLAHAKNVDRNWKDPSFHGHPVAVNPPVTKPVLGNGNKAREKEALSLAHDARNWLTVLQVYCDLLRTPGAVANGYQNWIEELSAAVTRGHSLVASLLDSAHGALTGTLPAKFTAPDTIPQDASAPLLNLSQALKRRLPLLQQLAGDSIEVEIETPELAGHARGNRAMVAISESDFERILHNLVGNAIEAMPQGGQLRIAISQGESRRSRHRDEPPNRLSRLAKRSGGERGNRALEGPTPTLFLQVSDTGAGIAPDLLPHIFESGVSSKLHESAAPRGFGLAIVRELTHRAGGSVAVRSNPHGGACFSIELPLAPGPIPRRAASRTDKRNKIGNRLCEER